MQEVVDSRKGGRTRSACLWGLTTALAAAWLSILESHELSRSHTGSLIQLAPIWIKLALAYAGVAGLGVGLLTLLLPRAGRHLASATIAGLCAGMLGLAVGWAFLSVVLGMAIAAALAATASARFALSWKALVGLWLASALLLTPLPSALRTSPSAAYSDLEDRPGNIVFLVVDTLRADHLSSWGYRAPGGADGGLTSPFIDSLASTGWRFDQAYAQAPWTRPSAASYLTGLHPQSHAISTQFDRLAEEVPTLAEFVHTLGYRTAGFSANPQVSAHFGLTQGFESFWNPGQFFQSRTLFLTTMRTSPIRAAWDAVRGKQEVAADAAPRGVPGSDADAVNAAVESWLRTAKEDPRPTFLYLHYLDPHDPYNAPVDYLYRDPNSAQLRDESVFHSTGRVAPRPLENSVMKQASAEELRGHIQRYDTEIRFVDQRLGEMLSRLEQEGIYQADRDLLIFISDHGEEFYEHGQWLHGQSLYDEMIRVPLILRGPGIPAGEVNFDPVQLIDLPPTIAEWIGEPLPWPVQGVSLLSDPRPTGEERFVFSHRPREEYPMDMVRVGDRKLIRVERAPGDPVYLVVDSVASGFEPVTASSIESVPEELVDLLNLYRETAPALRREGDIRVELDPVMRESLERLGYLDPAKD